MPYTLLETSRCIIRNLQPADLPLFGAYRSQEEVMRYQGMGVMAETEAAAFIESQKHKTFGTPGEWVQWAIAHKESGLLLGDCALKLQGEDPRIAEIGITLSPAEQRKGYATEVMRGLLRLLFAIPHFHRVCETVDARNTASIQLLRSLGFREEGHFIQNIFFKGAWGSEYVFALLRREWVALEKAALNIPDKSATAL